ncbi:MAG: hypothetical protein WCE48_02350 [Steroidobacteraceae bacterium]
MAAVQSPVVVHAAYRREDNQTLVELRLDEVRQLFDTLDPAPFRQKDLDADVEEYIVDAVREIGRHHPIKLVVYLPEAVLGTEDARTLPAAVRNYFVYRATQATRTMKLVLQRGFASVVVGVLFLSLCLSLRHLVERNWAAAAGTILAEGLLIVGWIALWRPLEIFLYDWWPILEDRMLYQWITRQTIEVRRS